MYKTRAYNSIQFYSHFYKIFTLYMVRYEYTNKGEEEEKRKLMAWIEVYGGQRSLAFEVTTAVNLSRANFLLH